jgi:hypothetical protein
MAILNNLTATQQDYTNTIIQGDCLNVLPTLRLKAPTSS